MAPSLGKIPTFAQLRDAQLNRAGTRQWTKGEGSGEQPSRPALSTTASRSEHDNLFPKPRLSTGHRHPFAIAAWQLDNVWEVMGRALVACYAMELRGRS